MLIVFVYFKPKILNGNFVNSHQLRNSKSHPVYINEIVSNSPNVLNMKRIPPVQTLTSHESNAERTRNKCFTASRQDGGNGD